MKKLYNEVFFKKFKGIKLDDEIEEKLAGKHKVLYEDIEDALSDPYRIIIKGSQKQEGTNSVNYEILAETINGRVLFIVGRLFDNTGHYYIISSHWADSKDKQLYYKMREVLENEDNEN